MEHDRLCDQPEVIADFSCEVGENPLWHPDDESYLVDRHSEGTAFRIPSCIKNYGDHLHWQSRSGDSQFSRMARFCCSRIAER